MTELARTRTRSGRRWAMAAAAVALLFATTACGSDSDGASKDDDAATTEATDTGPDDTSTDDTTPAAEGEAVSVTITEDGLQDVPTELEAGLMDVTVDDQSEGAGGDVSFTKVTPGTTEEDFVAGLEPVFAGGPFPDFMLNSAGAIESSSFVLEEGEYIVWSDLASNLDRESTPEDIVTASLTVGAGDDSAELPATDGKVTATDYHFDVEAAAGPQTLTFANDSDEQWHHVLIVDFGTNDPDVVEENIGAILEAEGDDLPEGIDGSQINFEFAGTSVFGPGSAGTFEADFEEGNTYVALCFISDLAGGAPHAIQHDMHEVFQVEAA